MQQENKYPIGGGKSLLCTLSDHELAAKADQLIDELVGSGGKSFVMHVPARPNADPDLIFAELNNRFKKLITAKPASAARETIEDILLKTGKHNPEQCSELADLILRDIRPAGAGGNDAVEFAEWLRSNHHEPTFGNKWVNFSMSGNNRFTTADLYKLWQQSKSK